MALIDDRKEIGTRPQHIQAIAKEVLESLFHQDNLDIISRDPVTKWCFWTENSHNRTISIEINGELSLDEDQQMKASINLGDVEVPEIIQADRLGGKYSDFRHMGIRTNLIIRILGRNKGPVERVAADVLYLLRSHMLNIEKEYQLDKFVALKMSTTQKFTEEEMGDPNIYHSDVPIKVEYQILNGPPGMLYKKEESTTTQK